MRPLLGSELKIVEKKKWFFMIPLALLLITIISLFIYKGVLGEPVNLGMDFSGGYTINIRLGANLTQENADEYKEIVTDVITNYSDANGENYGIKIDNIQVTGSGSDTALYVKYKAVGSDSEMQEINKGLIDKLTEEVTRIIPSVELSGGTVTLVYQEKIRTYESNIKTLLDNAGIVYTDFEYKDNSTITFKTTETDVAKIREAASIENFYSGEIIQGDLVSGSVSSDLLWRASLAVLISLAIMLIYIAIRFELISGIVAIVALIHDLLIMVMLMIICHIEFNSTIIAALITILGYSINNTIIMFDRVRENLKTMDTTKVTAAEIANKSIRETFIRSMNTTITTFIMIGMIGLVCAIGGIADMVTFALPIMFGLIAGTFSSLILAPSLWELMVRKNLGRLKSKKSKKEVKQTDTAVVADKD